MTEDQKVADKNYRKAVSDWAKHKKEQIIFLLAESKRHGDLKLTKDHIIPQSFIRKLQKDNIQYITKEQNMKKGDRLTKKGLEKILKAIIEHL